MIKHLCLCFLLVLVSGCSIVNEQMYAGELKDDSEHAVLSALGLYPENRVSMQVRMINGEKVNIGRAASYLLLPGEYEVAVFLQANMKYSAGGMSWQEADLVGALNAEAGHTYIPDYFVKDEEIVLTFEDKGKNFPQECLPLYVSINKSKNPGHAFHKDGRECKLE